jgi:hypothetical protein
MRTLPLRYRPLSQEASRATERLTVYIAGVSGPDQMFDLARMEDGALEVVSDGPIEVELISSNRFRIRRCRT